VTGAKGVNAKSALGEVARTRLLRKKISWVRQKGRKLAVIKTKGKPAKTRAEKTKITGVN